MIVGILSAVVVTLFLPIFMYTNNAEAASLIEIIPTMLLFLLIMGVVYGLTLLFTKNVYTSALAAIIFMILFENYSMIESVFGIVLPQFKYWHLVPTLFITWVHIVYLLHKKLEDTAKVNAVQIAGIAFGALIAVNVVTATPQIITKVSVSLEEKDKVITSVKNNQKLPNVYYLIFDEYSNFDTINKYYNYDNKDFAVFLENNGFTVSYDSANESFATATVITNYVSYDYVVTDKTPVAERTRIRQANPLKQLMQQNGYKAIGIGDTEWLGIPSETSSNKVSSSTKQGENIQQIIFKQTVLYPFVRNDSREKAKKVLNMFDYFENLQNYQNKNQFIMGYVECPHEPFLFDENGNPVSLAKYYEWEEPQYYLGQFKYVTQKITNAVQNILKYDPNCVIILQSDHSARWRSNISNEDKMKPFNAVYFLGENIDEIKGQSGVNTIRIVLNRMFNMNLLPLEVK